MKTILTITLILLSFFCIGQKLDTISTSLSKFEKAKYLNYENFIKEAGKIQQEHYKFLSEYIQANGIDLTRVSIHPDSLKYLPPDSRNTNGKFLFVLKPKKK